MKSPDVEHVLDPNPESNEPVVSEGIDRRAFLMRSALMGAVAVLTGAPPVSPAETAKKAATATTPKAKTTQKPIMNSGLGTAALKVVGQIWPIT